MLPRLLWSALGAAMPGPVGANSSAIGSQSELPPLVCTPPYTNLGVPVKDELNVTSAAMVM
jgi:hypothetical protein